MFLQEQLLSKHVSPGTTSLKACFSRNNTLSLSNHISPATTSLKACFSRNNTLSQCVFLQEQPLSMRVSPGTTSLKPFFSRNNTLSQTCFSRNNLSQSVFLQEHHSLSKRVSPGTTSPKACFSRSNTLSCFSNRQKKKKKKKKEYCKTGNYILFYFKYNAALILLIFDVKSYLNNCITVMVTWAFITNHRISLVCCQQAKCTPCRPEVWC